MRGVFFRDRDLGSVPVLLSKKECADLGLPTAPTAGIDHDGWGEGIVFFDRAQNVDTRLMLKVPDRAASRYLTIETPWGPRTKNAGGWDLPNGFRSRFMTRGQDGLGMTTTLDFDPSPRPGADKVTVTITVL